MSQPDIPTAPHDLRRPDAIRKSFIFVMLVCAAACNWLILPLIQSLIIPKSPGGTAGPWVIRPIQAFHFGAMALMTAVCLPILLAPLQRRWQREDAVAGARYDPFRNRPLERIRLIVAGFLLLLVYSAGLIFYLFSWTFIGPEGILERLPWGTRHHSFQEIESLESIPDGMRSDALVKNGPWYNIKLRSGRSIPLSLENEGLTSSDLTAVTAFVAANSGVAWEKRTDARPR